MLKNIAVATLVTGALFAVASPASAVVTTFATFSPSGSAANVLWTNSNGAAGTGTGGLFFSTATGTTTVPASRLVKFSFLLQPDLAVVSNVNANFGLNASAPTGNRAVLAGGFLIQNGIAGSFSFTTTTQITVAGRTYPAGSNLLSCTFSGTTVSGQRNGTSASSQGDTNQAGQTLTYTSDFLTFAAGNANFSISLASVAPALDALPTTGNPTAALRTFRALASGSFSSDPAPKVHLDLAGAQATASALLGGGPISDAVTVGGQNNPTGTLTFSLYSTIDGSCVGNALFTSVKSVNGPGNYASDPYTPTQIGIYNWVIIYSGDANYAPSSIDCGTPNQTSTIGQAPAITSANTTTFTARTADVFNLTATGYPTPDINLTSGSLPVGITYGSGSLAGTPEPDAFGTYALTFTASNGIGSNAVQQFSLVVNPSALDVQSRSAISANMGSGFQLAFLGNPGTQYTIQYTPTLISPNWQTLELKVADPNGTFFSIDHPPAGTIARFYRAIIP